MARRFDDRRLGCNREINLYWILSNACFYSVLLASEVNQYKTPSRAYKKKKNKTCIRVCLLKRIVSGSVIGLEPISCLSLQHSVLMVFQTEILDVPAFQAMFFFTPLKRNNNKYVMTAPDKQPGKAKAQ